MFNGKNNRLSPGMLKKKISSQSVENCNITSYCLNPIIESIESSREISSYGLRFRDIFIPFWMLIKIDFFYFLINSKHNKTNSISDFHNIGLILNWYKHRAKYKKTDFLFLSLPSANIITDKGSYNLYHDDFVFELSSLGYTAVALQLPHGEQYRKKEIEIENYDLNWTFLRKKWIKILPISFKQKKLSEEGGFFLKTVEKLLTQYFELDLINNLSNFLRLKLIYYQSTIQYDIAIWEELIYKYNPKYVVLPNVCEGGLFGLASLIAKKNGAVVIEAQHSGLSPKELWFNNYGSQQNMRYWPDFFWMYGDIWSSIINFPTKKVIIGNPYYSKRVEKLIQHEKKYDYLLILDIKSVENNKKVLESCVTVSEKILYRPHPFDKNDYHPLLLTHSGVKLDFDRDIWKSIAHSKAVIIIGNYFSTVGYEALSVGLPVIFITDTSQEIPVVKKLLDYIFVIDIQEKDMFSSISKYVESCSLSDRLESVSAALYDPNWRNNLKCWVTSIGLPVS